MPDIAWIHPIVVHFTIALLIAGVAFRWLAFLPKAGFAHHAATVLLVAGTLAALLAVESGDQAHGPAERIPGARPVVEEHEEHGERARNVFVAVALVDLAGWVLRRRKHDAAMWALVASAAIGAVGLWALYEAAEHGGELVYSWAGGVGTRSGEAEDVGRLLLAGLYHQARVDREAGRPEDAAELVALAAKRFPGDVEVQLLRADSLLRDSGRPAEAVALLRSLRLEESGFQRLRAGLLEAEALKATGDIDGARQVLEGLQEAFPQNQRLQRAIDEL
jgi:uncharacterized membrane protein